MLDFHLALSIAVPNIGGILSALGNSPTKTSGTKEWYDSLNKAPIHPPPRIFGPVWTILYTSMGVASYLIAKDGGVLSDYFPCIKKVESQETRNLLLLGYGAQLLLNFLWSPLFFRQKKVKLAMLDMLALVGVVSGLTYKYYEYNKYAAYMMIPYICWGSFATYITYYIYSNNDESKFN